MAIVGKYKALGAKAGGYKKRLYETQSLDYAKGYEDFKLARTKSIISGVEDTLAQIIGIAGELKEKQKFKEYGEEAKLLEGVETRTVTEKGFLGKEKEMEKYFDVKTGKELSESELQKIGYFEKFGINTGYSEGIPVRPDTSIPSMQSPIGLEEELISALDENEQMDMFGKIGGKGVGMPDLTVEEINLDPRGEVAKWPDAPKRKGAIGMVPHTMDMSIGDSSYRFNNPENLIMDDMLKDDYDSIWGSPKRRRR
jgi:hypothetical protein